MGKTLFGSLASASRGLINRSPVPFVSSRNLQLPWRHPVGTEAQMRAMGSVGTLFAIVNRTSNATAQVNWRLYRKAASGLKEDRVEVTSHAALDLINKPNEFFTRQELVESTQQHIDLTGEGWWVITRNPGSPLPLELWPVRPDRMAPIPDPLDFISGYTYTSPDGRELRLEVEDVIQIRMPNPLDPYRGMGPVQSILTEIDASRYSAEWNRNFFLNSAEPGGILEVDKHLTDPEFNEARDRWSEQHKGVSNAHRVALLENGIKWVNRAFSQRDMQFAELRAVSRDVMREAFGAPAFVLGEVGDVNRATADASKALFAEQLTVPRLERFKGALNNDLLPLYGKDAARLLEFDYDDPVPQDAAARNDELEAKTAAYARLVNANADPRLVAEYLGLPDIAGDPERALLVDIAKGAPSTAPIILPLLGFDVPQLAPAPAPQQQQPAAARLDLHHHVPYELPARQPSYNQVLDRPRRKVRAKAGDDAVLEQVREQFDAALEALLEAWEPIAEAQVDALAAQIEAAVDAGDTEALADLTADSGDATTVLRHALAGMAKTAAEQMAAEAAEQGVTVKPPKVDKALTNAFGSQLVEIAAAAAGLLAVDLAGSAGREALRLLVPGADGPGVAGQVGTFLRGLKNWFRTDQLGGALHRAQNIGRLATLAAAPPARYRADERNDKNTCPACREIDGTEWDTLDDAQAVYGAGGYPQCEGGIRCRGTVTAFWDTTEEASMGRTRQAWNTASPEQIAERGRAMRPAVAGPDGSDGWYRITNSFDEGGSAVASMYIYGDIGSWGVSAASCVEELKAIDAPEIRLYLNSPGGEVFDGLAVHNALRSHRARVIVQVDSLAASIASVIAMAGDRIIMSPHSQMMIHNAAGVSCGEASELREYADFLDRQSENIAGVYAERAGGTVKQWLKLMAAETWFFADEAVEAGLADEVAKPERQPDEPMIPDDRALAAKWDLSVYNYSHSSREDAPAPPPPAAPEAPVAPIASPSQVMNDLGTNVPAEPVALPVFDPDAFRAAAVAAFDPMPGYQPEHMRSLMAGVANDAPAVPVARVEPAPYVPPPVAAAPEADPRTVAVDYFRSLFTAEANHAPAAPQAAATAPAPPPGQTVYVPEPPPPAELVVADYLRAIVTGVANDAPAPPQTPAPDPVPPEPITFIDRTAIDRALWEARL
ncbi:head maturation protease, ClpP-related [Streptomyces umbrinus]|uniref:head maturation protease, ClpP-related n=1 Tax=Streptomyces umbrinus TaxID=67370 RepID=UPI003C2F7D15